MCNDVLVRCLTFHKLNVGIVESRQDFLNIETLGNLIVFYCKVSFQMNVFSKIEGRKENVSLMKKVNVKIDPFQI